MERFSNDLILDHMYSVIKAQGKSAPLNSPSKDKSVKRKLGSGLSFGQVGSSHVAAGGTNVQPVRNEGSFSCPQVDVARLSMPEIPDSKIPESKSGGLSRNEELQKR